MYDLKRFIDAQKGSYDIALGEIKKVTNKVIGCGTSFHKLKVW